MNKPVSFFVTAISAITINLGSAGPKDWQKALSAPTPGPYKTVKKCKLDYVLSWNGTINSGKFSVEFDRNTGSSKKVKVTSKGGTTGLARSFFPYDFKLTSKYRGDTLKPVSFNIWEKTRDESKTIDGKFTSSTFYSKEKTVPFETNKPLYSESKFKYPNIYDLYSSILFIGSHPLNKNDQINLVICPFDRPNYATVTVLGREKHKGHKCIKLDLKISDIKKDLTLKSYDKMKKATMWITDNSDRILVELRSEIFIGDVRATLKSSKWD